MKFGAGTLIAILFFAVARPAAGQTGEEHHRRADAALQSFLMKFWSQELGYLRHQFPGTVGRTGYWTFAAVMTRVLAAGDRRISAVFDSARGSSQFLNLDHLRLRPLSPHFIRADANADGSIDIADAARILPFLFGAPSRPLPCARSADSDANGAIEVTDAVYLLRYLFLLGPAPGRPFTECGPEDPAGPISCESYPPCE